RKLLRRCLERDRKKRLRDIGDALVEIDEALTGAPAQPTAPEARVAWRWPWIAATVLLAAALAGVLLFRKPPEQPTIRLQVQPPEGEPSRESPRYRPTGASWPFPSLQRAAGPNSASARWTRSARRRCRKPMEP